MAQDIPWKVLGDLLNEGLKKGTAALEQIATPPAPAAAPIVESANAGLPIPLDRIDPNPFQVRFELDEQKLSELTDNIRREGTLLQPILVRKVGERYQSIFGHRRVAAFRRLRDEAKTDDERARWATIPARELQNVTDDQMLLLALDENVLRSDLSPVEEALALSRLRDVRSDLHTADELAAFTGYKIDRVLRLLRLADAPECIRNAVHKGILVPVAPDPRDREPATQEVRRLDFSSALDLIAFHSRLYEGCGNKPNPEQLADEKVKAVIDTALKEQWSRARVQECIQKQLKNSSAPGTPKRTRRKGRPLAPFKRNKSQITIYLKRLDNLTNEQSVDLREALNEVLARLPNS